MPATRQHIHRAQYVTSLWCAAATTQPTRGMEPTNYGWRMVNGYLTPQWFEGESLPTSVLEAEEQSEPVGDVESPDAHDDDDYDDEPWSEDSDSD